MKATSVAPDVLPDISLIASALNDAYVSTSNSELPAGTRALRFSTASVNFGPGRFELRGGAIVGATQLVDQRIFRSDNTTWDRPAGTFVYHTGHGHIHFDDWTVFRLRTILPGDGVGSVIKTGQKTSFCILEINQTDTAIAGHNTLPAYNSCGQVQGLRPGWSDVYGSGLEGQYIELTGVADGQYWLEGEVDPNNKVLETNETNNVVRIKVTIGTPPPPVPDAYEDNDTRAIVNARPLAGVNSPNMGLVLNERTLNSLSMDDASDYFKVQLHLGEAGSYIQMESPFLSTADLDLQLMDLNGNVLRQSVSNISAENISLSGLAAGTYFIRVFSYLNTTNPNYFLKISPSANHVPILTATAPAAGVVNIEKSYATFPVTWVGSDPDNDPKLVTIFRSRVFGDSGSAQAITGYQNLPNSPSMVNMNTADFPLGIWYTMMMGTDGGAQVLSWAPGAVNIYLKGDMNADGHVHMEDYKLAQRIFRGAFRDTKYTHIMDMNRDGLVTSGDMRILWELANADDHND